MLIAIFWGLCCAIIGVAVVTVFGNDPSPFRGYFKWAQRWHELNDWHAWIASPIGGCVVCTSGQIALWSYSILRPWGFVFNVDWAWGDAPVFTFACDGMAIFLHLLAGCSGVLCAFTLNKLYHWLENRM